MATPVSQALASSLLAGALLFANVASAASPCDGVDTELTSKRKADYSRLIAESLYGKVKPSDVSVERFMQAGDWAVVYAAVPIADPGYFFFDNANDRPAFKEVWGGLAEKSETPDLIRWAQKLGANTTVAACFADAVTNR